LRADPRSCGATSNARCSPVTALRWWDEIKRCPDVTSVMLVTTATGITVPVAQHGADPR
jgi:hypothetical protein